MFNKLSTIIGAALIGFIGVLVTIFVAGFVIGFVRSFVTEPSTDSVQANNLFKQECMAGS